MSKINFNNVDCMEFMGDKPDNYYDLAIVDPPYGINVNMNMGKRKGEAARYVKKNWDKNTPSEEYFNHLVRVSKNQIIWGGITLPINLTRVCAGCAGVKMYLLGFLLVILS